MKHSFRYIIYLLVVAIVVSCGKDDPVEEIVQGIVEETKNETISATNGGMIETLTGVKIEVPPNAISSDKNITVEILDPSLYENVEKIPEGLKGEKISAVVRCGPEGSVFDSPVKITIPYYTELLHEQLTIDDIVVISYSGDSLELLTFTIDKANNEVIAETSHFSDFAVVTNLFEYEGYIYKTTIINGVEWLAENFRYLPSLNSSPVGSSDEPAFGVYDYYGTSLEEAKATDNYKKMGAIYNWPAAIHACPFGWQLPTKDDWDQLLEYINDLRGPYPYNKNNDNMWHDINKHLKAEEGWIMPGRDDFGFSAVRTYIWVKPIDPPTDTLESAQWWGTDAGAPRGNDFAWFFIMREFSYDDIFISGMEEGGKDALQPVRYIRD